MKYIKVRTGKKKKKQDYLNGEFRRLKEDIQKHSLSMIREFIEKFSCKSDKKYWLKLQIHHTPNEIIRYQITYGLVTTNFSFVRKSYKSFLPNVFHTGHPSIQSLILPEVYIYYESTQELQHRWQRFKNLMAFL